MKVLFIAEKKSFMDEVQAVYEKIKHTLPYEADFNCFAGHIIARKEPREYVVSHPDWGGKWEEINLPMIPSRYELKITRQDIFKKLTSQIKAGNYDCIVNACDADREGQAIFELFKEQSGLRLPVKRLWNNDITDKGIEKGLRNLKDNTALDMAQLKDASMIRGEFDWLVGMNFTIAYTLKLGGLAKVGRVQTPTLAILVKREKEILNFKPVTDYELHCLVGDEEINAVYISPEDGKVERFRTMEEARQFEKNLSMQVKVVELSKEEKKKAAPKLFEMSVLQTEGSRAFGYTADEVLSSIQFLYEQKILTYPRTDCEYLSSEMVNEFPEMLSAVGSISLLKAYVDKVTKEDMSKVAENKSYVNDKKLKESGHSAIAPTGQKPNFEVLEARLSVFNKDHKTNLTMEHVKNMLLLVYKRFLSIFLPEQRTLSMELILDNNGYLFKATGSRVVQMGWMEVYQSNGKDTSLPEFEKGQRLAVKKYTIEEKTTTCPQRFTDGTLIAVMKNPARYLHDENLKGIISEKQGIGTPATRAEIIKELIKNEYVQYTKGKAKGKYLQPTEKGMSLIDSLGNESIASVDMTGEWESKLKSVEMGAITAQQLRTEMNDYIIDTMEHIRTGDFEKLAGKTQPKSLGVCPLCGKEVRYSTKGSYYCTGFKEGCTYGFHEDAIKGITGKKLTEKNVEEILKTGRLTNQKGKSKSGTTYSCCFVVNHDKEKGRVNFKLEFVNDRKKG